MILYIFITAAFLMFSEKMTKTAKKRLEIMRKTEDGFEIADLDLKLRGAGELLGTRQSGLPEFKLADLTIHANLMEIARKDASLILANDNLNPDKMFDSALRDPKLMLDLKKTVLKMDDYEVTRAFNAAIFQRVFAKNPDIASNPTAFKQYLSRNINQQKLASSFVASIKFFYVLY